MSKKANTASSSTEPPSCKRLKVLHIIPSVSPNRGGPSKAVIEMVHALQANGIDAAIVTTNENINSDLDVPLNQWVEYKSVPVHFFKRSKSSINALQEFSYSSDFKHWLKANIERYDVIHVHALFSFLSSYAMWLARKKKIPYIVRPIGQLEDWALQQSGFKKKIYLNLIEKANLEAASSLHFTAESEKTQAVKHFDLSKPVVIPLGIDSLETLTNVDNKEVPWVIKPNVPVICYLSRLHPKKGLDILLKALANMSNIDFQFIIAGSGEASYESFLKEMVSELNLENKCQFVGFIEGSLKNRLLQSSDIFILTSRSENFGISVIEAMANGTMPFISNEVALSDVINDHHLGVTCSLNVDDIKSKLEEHCLNLEQCAEYGHRSKQFVAQHYQWSNIAQRLKALYSTLIEID